MQLLAYIENEYSSNLIRKFVTSLQAFQCSKNSCEATIIFDEFTLVGWKSPIVVTIKDTAETGLVISSQRFHRAGSKHNGKYLFQQIYRDLLPAVVAIERGSLLLADAIEDLSCRYPQAGPYRKLLHLLKQQLDQSFCFYLNGQVLKRRFKPVVEKNNYNKVVGSGGMSNYSIIQFVK